MPTSPDDIHNKANLAALACVVMVNWVIAHLANPWVMPQEVQSSAQTLVSMGVAIWLAKLARRAAAKANGATA